VLITGETGTGKGLVARALHLDSPRASGAFVTVNCAALPEALLESELFGHVKGAFTGAVSNRAGLFAEANGGSLFLDEIGDMPLAMQAKLLHALERGAVRRVGAEKEQTLDVRILAATNRDLRKAVRAGSFREDLLYRLDAIPIEVPALRHRTEDIPVLLEHFLRLARARQPGAKLERIGPSAGEALREYPWPGNVRELMHLVERLVALTRHAELGLDDLPQNVRTRPADAGPQFSGDIIPIRSLERRYAEWALDQMAGQKGKTASRLGIDEKTLWRWLNERGPDDE
jgi:two-component system response regulator HydG